jgi:quinoprotein glucose dehydrogenase
MPRSFRSVLLCGLVAGWSPMFSGHAQHTVVTNDVFALKAAAPGHDAAEKAIGRMTLPPGWKAEVWAAEPDVVHPVAFDVVDDGRVFVAESLRAWRGVPDIRPLPSWLDEDLAARTVEDRLAMMRRHLGDAGLAPYGRQSERIRLLTDTDRDGRADRSAVFAEGFNTPLDGVASSVLVRGNEAWFANIPNVWHLKDTDGDGRADERRSLSYGHGVRISMLGHDLHGLTWGPDGRIYVSVGDRASHVLVNGRRVGNPDCGAVFRFEPDGSGFEMFASGLRNPQELVFDDDGNLFTGDNSANTGDESRWVHVLEGSDSGWHIGWQWTQNALDFAGAEGAGASAPWNTEAMWHTATNTQPAYILPPVANISAGPCGNALYPGTGLGSDWDGTFVLADFRGSSSGSGFWRFRLKPSGAGFTLTDRSQMLWQVNATDGCWGPDGAFWLLDWTDGWEPEGRGRIYRCFDPARIQQPEVIATAQLLRTGFGGRSVEELIGLLGHKNRRVRQGAQFQLAAVNAVKPLMARARAEPGPARLHALWALEQIARHAATHHLAGANAAQEILNEIVGLTTDSASPMRAQAARILGDHRWNAGLQPLVRLTADPEPAVRAAAAIALGKLANPAAIPALATLIRATGDTDATLRHAAMIGLAGCADADALLTLAHDAPESVRLAVVVALRRHQRGELGRFLSDASERVVLEAARAIHDLPVPSAMADLAALIARPMTSWALARRVIDANLRVGSTDGAKALVALARDARVPAQHRAEALAALEAWPKNSGRDRVTSLWRPTGFARTRESAAEAFEPVAAELLGPGPDEVRRMAIRASSRLEIASMLPGLRALARDTAAPPAIRTDALSALATRRDAGLGTLLSALLDDADASVRALALTLSTQVEDAGTVSRLERVLKDGSTGDRQAALTALGASRASGADSLLAGWVTAAAAGKAPPAIELDILEAARRRDSAEVKAALASYAATLPGNDPLAKWRTALAGGDARSGQRVFNQKAEVECVRCHKLWGRGGEVGPALDTVGAQRDARYLLEAIVAPNATIAPGFESVVITLRDDTTLHGVLRRESDAELELQPVDGESVTIRKSEVASRDRAVSAMPEGFGEILSARELRDLVAFLASLK